MTTKKPGRWKPGESGNPKGRKPGTGEVGRIRASISARVPELLAALMARALAGDVGAARLLLERAVAPLKAAEQPQVLSLPSGTLTEQGRAVLASVAAGELAAGAGAALLGAIGTLARVSEIDELAARVAALESLK
ncbi:hypothetical protein BSY239_843 [Hydrogenophaga sp. RAC07]|uniref:DUF5681 domain-containing protein n=1 Tax=Hydrogenophaga sp. RAC07 TaxID=1842537 RepID=UPI00083D4FDE|nr:DUF5681 domain-containing protein [Hydrogenophaga sp. RAC07]AOF85799.1 hypothetical protein BSY239_843 [Hydrogenophaga sp. RAC07]